MAKPAAPRSYPKLSLGSFVANSPPGQQAPALPRQAAQDAQRTVAAQIQQLHAQQAQDEADARARAGQILQATQGAAKFLQPLGNMTRDDYAAALAQNTGLAQGYSGQLRQDAASDAAKAQATLARIPGNTQQVTDQGGSLANLLYGLQGAIPGRALITEGLGATAAARALPGSVLGFGQQEALGVLGAGRQDARALDPRIAEARGSLPGLTREYLADLVKQRTDAQQEQYDRRVDQRDYQLKVAEAKARAAGDIATAEALAAYRASQLAIDEAQLGVSRFNAETGRISATKPAASQAPSLTGSGATGYGTYDPATRTITPVPGRFGKPTSATATRASAGLSPSQAKGLAQQITAWKAGMPETTTTPAVEPLPYIDAMTRALAQAPGTNAGKRKAMALVNAEYGTPQSIALQAAKDAKTGGHGLTEALTIILQQAKALPLSYYIPAFSRIYGAKAGDIKVILSQLGQLISSGQVPSSAG